MNQIKSFPALSGKTFTGEALLEGDTTTTSLTITEIEDSPGFYEFELPDVAGLYIIKIYEEQTIDEEPVDVWVGSGDVYVEPEVRGKVIAGDASGFTTDLTGDVDDEWNGQVCRFYSGANKGKNRQIGNYVGSTKRLEFVVPFSRPVAAGDRFEIIGLID